MAQNDTSWFQEDTPWLKTTRHGGKAQYFRFYFIQMNARTFLLFAYPAVLELVYKCSAFSRALGISPVTVGIVVMQGTNYAGLQKSKKVYQVRKPRHRGHLIQNLQN